MSEYLYNLSLVVAFILTLAGAWGAVFGMAVGIVDEKPKPLGLALAAAILAALAFAYIVTFA